MDQGLREGPRDNGQQGAGLQGSNVGEKKSQNEGEWNQGAGAEAMLNGARRISVQGLGYESHRNT